MHVALKIMEYKGVGGKIVKKKEYNYNYIVNYFGINWNDYHNKSI